MLSIDENPVRKIINVLEAKHCLLEGLLQTIFSDTKKDPETAIKYGEIIDAGRDFLKSKNLFEELSVMFSTGGPTKYVTMYKFIAKNITHGYVRPVLYANSDRNKNYLQHYLFVLSILIFVKGKLSERDKIEILGVLDIGLIGSTEFISKLITSSGLDYDVDMAAVAQYIRTENEACYVLNKTSFTERMQRQALCDFSNFLTNSFQNLQNTVANMLHGIMGAKQTDVGLLRFSQLPERSLSSRAVLLIDSAAICLNAYGVHNFGEDWPLELIHDSERCPQSGKPISHMLKFIDYFAYTLMATDHSVQAFEDLIESTLDYDLISSKTADELYKKNKERMSVKTQNEIEPNISEFTMDCGDMEVTITTRKKIAVASESPKVSNLPELNIPIRTLTLAAWTDLFSQIIESKNLGCIFSNEYIAPKLTSFYVRGIAQQLHDMIEKLNLLGRGVDKTEGMRFIRNVVLEYQDTVTISDYNDHRANSIILILLGYSLAGIGDNIPSSEIEHLVHLAFDYELINGRTCTKIKKMLEK